MPLTQTMREYLKTAYRLCNGGDSLTVTALAEAQRVAPASATAMVKKLTRLGLFTHPHYGAIRLTEEGVRQALLAVRRHRLLECFLVRVLRYGVDEVHDESHRLEPAISERFVAKMDDVLGHPRHCPHGDPIPDVNGAMEKVEKIPLTQLEEGRAAQIATIPGSKRDLLRYLIKLGIIPERPICVLRREPFGGPLHLKLGRKTVLLGPEAAEHVYVCAAEA